MTEGGIRIGLLSDTHGFLDERVFEYFADVDEIWHAGDIGPGDIPDRLEKFKPFKAVWGNIDDPEIRRRYPEDDIFIREGLKIWMTHIGGKPPKYNKRVKELMPEYTPGMFICGHSHILKVMPDQYHQLLYINPGAAGRQGFHKVRTLIRFSIEQGKARDLEVIELNK